MINTYFKSAYYTHLLLTAKSLIITGLFISKISVSIAQSAPFPLKPIDEQRVQEIEKMLSDKPSGFGEPYNKREVWDKLLKSGNYDRFLRGMRNYSFPSFSKDDYFSLSNGSASSSKPGLTMMRKRAEGLAKATWAECLQNEGRYTRMVEDGLRDILKQKSWVSPRSDYDFKNYNGVAYSVELTSSLYAHTITQTLYMMGDKISPKLRKEALDALYTRIFNPIHHKFKTQNDNKENHFLIADNNWNHVCLAGLVGAALTVIEDKHERAVFTYIGEYYSKNGLVGFEDDGYCVEGVTYYNYGFGHYILLRESIWQATGGKIDLFDDPKVQKISRYAPNIEIINGVYPAISDGREGAKPDEAVMIYLNRTLGLGIARYDTLTNKSGTSDNRKNVMMAFPNSSYKSQPEKNIKKDEANTRSFFEQTGVLVSRPLPTSSAKIGVALKGGNNGESHNHNDIGSYTIVQGKQIMVGDPGVIPYTNNIFDAKYRYTYKTIGSYGHPVPLVAGTQQQAGAQARSRIVHTDFTKEKDNITLDIASAYDVPELKRLERIMDYDRSHAGSITFTDSFAYANPQEFETAISTRSEWKQTSDSTLLLTRESEKMLVTFFSPGNKLLLKSEEIAEGGTPYTRIGISIAEPVIAGQIIITYKPQN
ncbi:heparinase II/III family protein [Parapedobacter tibetensis]|nr:heparinase II/III family protein [Parapedobacter tibetensis]